MCFSNYPLTNFDWFIMLFAPVVIDRSYCFGIGFSTVTRKPLYKYTWCTRKDLSFLQIFEVRWTYQSFANIVALSRGTPLTSVIWLIPYLPYRAPFLPGRTRNLASSMSSVKKLLRKCVCIKYNSTEWKSGDHWFIQLKIIITIKYPSQAPGFFTLLSCAVSFQPNRFKLSKRDFMRKFFLSRSPQ